MRFELMREIPADFESAALTTRPRCHLLIIITLKLYSTKIIHFNYYF